MTMQSGRHKDICYPAAGVRTDFDNLLIKFTESGSVRYEDFADLWRKLKCQYILTERPSRRETIAFIGECLRIGVQYLLPPYTFQVRVGALYLLYAIYLKQPCEPKVKIRVTVSQWQETLELMADVQKQHHSDVLYVFTKLRLDKAFHFVHLMNQVHPLFKSSIERLEQGMDQLKEQASILGEMFDVEQLSAVHDQYHRLKCALAGPNMKNPDKSIDVVHSDVVQYMTKSVTAFEEWRKNKGKRTSRKQRDSFMTTSESESEPEQPFKTEPTSGKQSRRAQIKERAYTSTASLNKSRRHRQVKEESIASPPPKSPRSGTSPRKQRRSGVSESEISDAAAEASHEEEPLNLSGVIRETLLHMPVLTTGPESATETTVRKKRATKRRAKESTDNTTTKSPSLESSPESAGPSPSTSGGRSKAGRQGLQSTPPTGRGRGRGRGQSPAVAEQLSPSRRGRARGKGRGKQEDSGKKKRGRPRKQ